MQSYYLIEVVVAVTSLFFY